MDYIDRLLAYYSRRQRYSKFTPLNSLRRQLGLSEPEATQAIKAFQHLGLGQRQYKTFKHSAGIRWNETEIRKLLKKETN